MKNIAQNGERKQPKIETGMSEGAYDRHTRICTVTIRLTWPTVYTYPPVKLATDYRVPTP